MFKTCKEIAEDIQELKKNLQKYNFYNISIKNKNEHLDLTFGDPWNGRTLEWATHSPPPVYNFALIPRVDQIDPLWAVKQGTRVLLNQDYEDILSDVEIISKNEFGNDYFDDVLPV